MSIDQIRLKFQARYGFTKVIGNMPVRIVPSYANNNLPELFGVRAPSGPLCAIFFTFNNLFAGSQR